jgi:HEAT repeat protein
MIMQIIVVLVLAFFSTAQLPASVKDTAWNVLTLAIDAGGPEADSALALLGSIQDPRARQVMDRILKGSNDSAIDDVAEGLTPVEANNYLTELKDAALRNVTHPRPRIISAMARAGTAKAATALRELANQGTEPMAGLAFGMLSEMVPTVADPELIMGLLQGASPQVRETAGFVLVEKWSRSYIPVFRSALKDPRKRVRLAAALGLAKSGISDGVTELKATANGSDKDLRLDAIVALASLGEPKAISELKQLVKTSDGANKARVVWAIASFGAPGLKRLTYELGLNVNPIFVSMLAEKLYDPSDARDLSAMRSALKGGDIPGLAIAGELLGTSADKDAAAEIIRGLATTSQPMRDLAVQIAVSHPRFWPALSDRLKDPDPSIKLAALDAIKNLHQTGKFDEVAECFSNPNTVGSVSQAAARTMAALDSPRALEYFSEKLSSSTGYARVLSAAMVLIIWGELGQTATAH